MVKYSRAPVGAGIPNGFLFFYQNGHFLRLKLTERLRHWTNPLCLATIVTRCGYTPRRTRVVAPYSPRMSAITSSAGARAATALTCWALQCCVPDERGSSIAGQGPRAETTTQKAAEGAALTCILSIHIRSRSQDSQPCGSSRHIIPWRGPAARSAAAAAPLPL